MVRFQPEGVDMIENLNEKDDLKCGNCLKNYKRKSAYEKHITAKFCKKPKITTVPSDNSRQATNEKSNNSDMKRPPKRKISKKDLEITKESSKEERPVAKRLRSQNILETSKEDEPVAANKGRRRTENHDYQNLKSKVDENKQLVPLPLELQNEEQIIQEKQLKRPPAPASSPKMKTDKIDLETTKKSSKPKKKEPEDMNMTQQKHLLEKFKGPFVHIQGDIENPRCSNVINPRISKKDNLDSISRVTSFGHIDPKVFGIPLTTISSEYDDHNIDESWICMFCRKSSHYCGLGDLFGPYFVTSDQGKSLNLPSPVKTNSRDLVSSFILGGSDQAGAKAKKGQKKKSGTPESPLKGSKQTGDQNCEVWFHEDCICWLPQIRLIGNQILGLPEAIKVTQKAVCLKCGYRGCTIACSQKKCHETAHFPCAQELHWEIDEDDFLARCANCVSM